MPNGFARGRGGGFGFRRGMGFGFRGSSPPWPYVGIGRGGLPRCGYFFAGVGASIAPTPWTYQQAAYPANYGSGAGQNFYPPNEVASPAFGNTPFTPQPTSEQEIDLLKDQAEAIKRQLEQIESRIDELESEE